MAQFGAWIPNPAMELQGSIKPPQSLYSCKYNEPSAFLSWNSEEDTDSDSELSFSNNNSFASRRKPLTHRTKMHKFQAECVSRAAPVAIPARTHDFGWCDRDDERISSTTCPCGNDCDEFFQGELDDNGSSPSKCSRPEEDSDEFIFDMEM